MGYSDNEKITVILTLELIAFLALGIIGEGKVAVIGWAGVAGISALLLLKVIGYYTRGNREESA